MAFGMAARDPMTVMGEEIYILASYGHEAPCRHYEQPGRDTNDLVFLCCYLKWFFLRGVVVWYNVHSKNQSIPSQALVQQQHCNTTSTS